MFENIYNVSEETADEVINEIIAWENDLKKEQGLLYDEWLKIQRQVETIYDLYPLNAKEEEALNVLLKRQFEIETKLDEIEIELRAE